MATRVSHADDLGAELHSAGLQDNLSQDAVLRDLVKKDMLIEVAKLSPTQRDAVVSLIALKEQRMVMASEREKQLNRIRKRCSTEQWLDENEREWMAMDRMLAARPWALRKDQPFKYPFREATNRMRKIEGPWLGDDEYVNLSETRGEAASPVLVNIRPVVEHPASHRLVLFAPEFGSENSYLHKTWNQLKPLDTCDIWMVSWQGWDDFDRMIEYVYHKVLSMADGVSTVWYAHSFGAIVAYEVLKKFEGRELPNLPVALIVSGSDAPDAISSTSSPTGRAEYLIGLNDKAAVDNLGKDTIKELKKQFGIGRQATDSYGNLAAESNPIAKFYATLVSNSVAAEKANGQGNSLPPELQASIVGDLQVIKSYSFKHASSPRLLIPVVAVDHDEDPLSSQEQVGRWAAFAPEGEFEQVHLEDESDDPEAVALQGHGYAFDPVPALLEKITAVMYKHELRKVESDFADIGPTDGDLPEEIDVVVVGAGVAGIGNANVHREHGKSVVVLDKYPAIGGIWKFYANKFSRVNSSEPAYRLFEQSVKGPTARPNEDHSPTYDIMRDIHDLAAERNKGDFRLSWEVLKVDKLDDGTYTVKCKNVKDGREGSIHTKAVSMHVNRRIGERRDVTWPGGERFRGVEVYGYANEVLGLDFWGKRVIVVGAGAFAYENLRTALEHGAKHVTILGRRSGTTCPKWIDMIAFLRPVDKLWNTSKAGNVVSIDVWNRCYEDAGLPKPDCWKEGLLKPHNHTVSVSDLAFIGGYYGMASLLVGEIAEFRTDGHGVVLKDGRKLDADIIIKATGFHINRTVPDLTGRKNIHSWGCMDFNLVYGAEPILDGGQFGSQKGRVVLESDETDTKTSLEELASTLEKLNLMNLPHLDMAFGGFNNPFGSAYVGHMLSQARFNAYLVANPEIQQALIRVAGKGKLDAVELWASQSGQSSLLEMQKIAAALAPA
mmetsp:Transcript_45037/g.106989  ORF Transcript_45037/g.106989 Transcript_45037/m.106989 type:complete len:948 (+) Transcript_45037:80-2923(+)